MISIAASQLQAYSISWIRSRRNTLPFFAVIPSISGLTGAGHVKQATSSSHRSNLVASSCLSNHPMVAHHTELIAHSSHKSMIENGSATQSNNVWSLPFERSVCTVFDNVFDLKPRKGIVISLVVDLNSENVTTLSPDSKFLHTGS